MTQETKVRFHSGYKHQETPTSFSLGNTEYQIKQILLRKRVKHQKTGRITEIFECITNQGKFKIEVSEDRAPNVTRLNNNPEKRP